MKTIGLIGGMSWESTATYYRLINEGVKAHRGGHHSAKIVMNSVDFAEIEALQRTARWVEAGELLASAARSVELAGADFIVMCTNTMHNVAGAIERAVRIPLLHIADPTAEAIKTSRIRTVALLGTRFTMEQDFYAGRLRAQHGLDVRTPDVVERDEIHRAIYDELVHGKVVPESKRNYLRIIERMRSVGAEAVILGCTEIAMLVSQADLIIPAFDTTALHAQAAVARCLSMS